KKVSDQKDNTRDTSANTKFAKQSIVENLSKISETHALSKPVTLNSVTTPQESNVVKNDKVIAPGMFRINPFKTSREENHVPNTVRASLRTKPITVSVPSASKSSRSKNKEAEVEEHHRNLLLSKNNKHMSLACNNIKLDSQDVISKVVCAMCFGDLQWGNILITRVYFIKGLGHNLFSVGQFCDWDSESWLWHQRLSHLNFDTINDLAKNDLVLSLPKFRYHKEHLCPSYEQGKSKRASHPPKPVPNSRQRLHLLYMDLYGPMRIASINGKRALCYPKNDREDIGKLGAK
nr:hypothetical protein [Tanacetum cinerariifolium]